MHPRVRVAPALVLVAPVLALLAGGCASAGPDRDADVGRDRPTATPGGPAGPSARPPRAPMDAFEAQVAHRLAGRAAASGLHVEYLDCPPWHGHVPAAMSCRGYVDGLATAVYVRLRRTTGRAVGLDAWLADGLIATRNLEATVRGLGWSSADCGSAAAYPATVGARITCRVRRGHRTSFVVATVRSRAGAVAVGAYAGRR